MPDSKVEVKACPFNSKSFPCKIDTHQYRNNPTLMVRCSEHTLYMSIDEWNDRSPIANNGVSVDSIVDKLTHLNGDHLMGLELNDIHIIANFITRLQPTAPRGGGEEQS